MSAGCYPPAALLAVLLLAATIDPRLVEPLRLAAIRAFLAILNASDERREDAITFLVLVLGLMRV